MRKKIKVGCYVRVLSGRFRREVRRVSKIITNFTVMAHGILSSYYYVYCPTGVRNDYVLILDEKEVINYFETK